MNLKLFALLAYFSLSSCNEQFLKPESRREVRKSKLGATEIIDHHDDGLMKTVILPSQSYHADFI